MFLARKMRKLRGRHGREARFNLNMMHLHNSPRKLGRSRRHSRKRGRR